MAMNAMVGAVEEVVTTPAKATRRHQNPENGHLYAWWLATRGSSAVVSMNGITDEQ